MLRRRNRFDRVSGEGWLSMEGTEAIRRRGSWAYEAEAPARSH